MNHCKHPFKRRLLTAMLLVALSAPCAAAPAPSRISLNFINADIESVVKAMSEMTGRTFIVDPRVKGTLNITSPRPVSSGTAYEILLASLRMQGFAAVEAEGVVRIVPEADAKFYAAPSKGKTRKARVSGAMSTRVFSLKHESATQLMPVLRPLVGANSALNADAGSNTLLVTDYADNIDRLAQIIENLDTPSVDEPVLITVRHAVAGDVAALISRVFTPQAAPGGELERLDIAVDARSNSLIVRGRDRSLVSKVQNLVTSLDTPASVAGNVHVVYMKNAEAVKVAETLRRILAADASAPLPTQTAATAATSATPNTPGARPVTPSASADNSGAGMVQADQASNALIITASDAVFENIKAVIEKLDVRRAQVLVEALIVEVSADKAAEFGIQWAGATSSGTQIGGLYGNSNSTTNIGTIGAALATGNPAVLAKGASSGLNLALFKDQSLGLLARSLETQADANILSTPTLLTLDNEEAKISVGSNVPFKTGTATITGTATPFETIERKDVGLSLKVKPQISEGGTVRMQISQEVSKLREAVDPTLSSTDKRSIDSTVLVDDGQIVVLGGLIEEQVQESEDKVPVLGDIPVLGHLFRYDSRKHVKTNLMVFLRPVIIRDAKDAAAATNPRYEYIRGEQQAAAPSHKPLLPDIPAPSLKYEMNLQPATTSTTGTR